MMVGISGLVVTRSVSGLTSRSGIIQVLGTQDHQDEPDGSMGKSSILLVHLADGPCLHVKAQSIASWSWDGIRELTVVLLLSWCHLRE